MYSICKWSFWSEVHLRVFTLRTWKMYHFFMLDLTHWCQNNLILEFGQFNSWLSALYSSYFFDTPISIKSQLSKRLLRSVARDLWWHLFCCIWIFLLLLLLLLDWLEHPRVRVSFVGLVGTPKCQSSFCWIGWNTNIHLVWKTFCVRDVILSIAH